MRLVDIILFALGTSCLVIPDPAGSEKREVAERSGSATAPHEPASALEILTKRQEYIYYDCRVPFRNYPAHLWGRVDVTYAVTHRVFKTAFPIGDLTVTVYAAGDQSKITIDIANKGEPQSVFFGEWDSTRATKARALTKMTVDGHGGSAIYNCVPITSFRGFFFLQLTT